MKKVLATLLVLAMIVTGLVCLNPKASEVKAASNATDHGTFVTVEKAKWDDLDKDGVPDLEGYLFAGYFKSENCTLADKSSKGNATHAKFVKDDMLDVKVQTTNGVVQKSDVEDKDGNKVYEGKHVIRFISSVESLNYSKIGFELEYTTASGETKKVRNTSSKVFTKIESTTGVSGGTIDKYEFSPKVVGEDSEYFMTAKLPVEVGNEAVTYKVRAFWTTLDGTTVMGKTRCVSVNDGNNEIVNMTVDAKSQLDVQAEYTATYGPNADPTAEGAGTSGAKVEVLSSDADGHTNIRITLQGDDTATSLKSATKFVIFDKDGNEVATGVYRNYYTKYTGSGTADTSWYDVEPTATRFAIATSADLYGLASVVSAGTDQFAGDEIHVVRGITLNKGKAMTSEETGGAPTWVADAGETTYSWNAIGTSSYPFKGVFDGDGNEISGLYRNFGTNWYVGFFGCTAVGSEFKNFKLTNSYIRADGNGVGIVGKGMVNKFENVYTDWIIHCERSGDSGLGGLWGNPTDISNLTTEINNCWFDGEIYRVNGNLVGGFVGCLSGSKSVMNFNDCLFTGTVKNMAGARYGAIIAGATWNDSIINVKNSFVLGDVKTTSATVSGAVAGYLSSTTKLNLENVFVSDASSLDYYGSMTASNFSQTNVQKVARNTICGLDQDEINALFNDSTDAWVPDNTVNDIDRGTPILQEFAEWWQNKQYESKVVTSWYNETDTEFVLTSASQLYGLAKIVNDGTDTFSGKTIKLGADIALNKADSKIVQKWVYGSAIAENEWVPIGTSTNKFAGVFDGQGHTISGLYLDTNVEGAGLFGYSAKPSEFKNFKLVDSYMKTSASRLGIVGRAGVVSMENIYTNAIMISTATANDGLSDVGGLIGTIDLIGSSASDYTNIYTTITNCWFDGYIQISNAGRKAGGFIGGMGGNASVGFYNCLSTGTVTGGYNLGGFFGAKDTYATCDIKNCLSVATVTANPINSANASKYGSFFGDHSASNYNSKMSTSYGTIKIIGAGNNPATGIVKTRDDIMMTDVATLFPESTAWVGDKKLGYNNTDRGTPILATFAEWWIENVNHDELTVDFSWYNDTDTEFTLYDAADLNGFAYIANNTDDFTGKTVKLGANIQLNEVNDDILTSLKQRTVILENKWTPIGTSEKPFNGTFDGENYEISGLYLNATTNGAGMFGTTAASATFKNFKLVDSYMRSASENLGIVGKGTLNGFENVYTNAIMDSETHAVAGFVGQVVPKDNSGNGSFHTSFKNCWFDGEIIQRNASSYAMGGFVGVSCTTGVSGESNGAGIEFLNCLSTGTITGGYRLGGFYGWKSNYAKLEFRNCLSVATLTSDPESNNPTYVGAFVGDHTTSRYNAKAYDSYGIGTIVGNYSGTAKEFETTTYNKTRSYLIDTDESTLFPVLSGETENAWVNDIGYNAVNRGTPILGTFDEFWLARQPETELIDRADTSWYNDNDTEFVLTTQGQLYGLSQLGQTNTFAGKTIKLGKDIALNKVDVNSVEAWKNDEQPAGQWKPLVGFAGTFDGQGNTISGLYLNTTTASAGMFGTTTATAVIKDFQLVDSYMKSTAKGLGIVGTGTFASMENVYTSAVMVSTSTDVAGFAGTVATNGGTVLFDNCWFDGEIIHTGDYLVGGFVGEDAGATVITFNNCLNTGKITGTSKVGGFM